MLKLHFYIEGFHNERIHYIFPLKKYECSPKRVPDSTLESCSFYFDKEKIKNFNCKNFKKKIEEMAMSDTYHFVCSDFPNVSYQGTITPLEDRINLWICSPGSLNYCDTTNCIIEDFS